MKRIYRRLLTVAVFFLLTIGSAVCVKAANNETYINPNTWYTDNLTDYRYANYYHFRLDSPGKVSVSFQQGGMNDYNNYWECRLISFNGSNFSYINPLVIQGNATSGTSNYAGLPAGQYTLVIDSAKEFSSNSYKVRVNYTAASNWEQEWNNSISTANLISLNKEYYGSLCDYMDKDYFRFRLTSPTRVRLSFRHGALNSFEEYWQILLERTDVAKEYVRMTIRGNETQRYSGYVTLPAGYYAVRVSDAAEDSDRPYAFRVMTASASKISITKCKVASVPVQVYSGKAICPSPALKYGNKILVKNKDYTVSYQNNRNTGKAAIIFTGKGSYTGKGAKYFYIRPAAITGVKAKTSSGGKMQVSWKAAASGAGYYLLVGTNQNFTGNVSGYYISGRAKTSKLITGLTKGKKYYFKVRAYQISGKTRINGVYSPTYRVTAK